jgi:hypothetical protein
MAHKNVLRFISGISYVLSSLLWQLVMAGADSPRAVLNLQSRCLEPGKYATHLEKWLLFYRYEFAPPFLFYL